MATAVLNPEHWERQYLEGPVWDTGQPSHELRRTLAGLNLPAVAVSATLRSARRRGTKAKSRRMRETSIGGNPSVGASGMTETVHPVRPAMAAVTSRLGTLMPLAML